MEIFYGMEESLSYAGVEIYGGREAADRVMLGFGRESENGYPCSFPIDTLIIRPLIEKFSDDLTHRDFLGAVMNLGIEREMLGDIVVKSSKCNTAYLFCCSSMTEYITEHLTRIKHTSVSCTCCTGEALPDLQIVKEPLDIICASPRIDAVISGITRLSRSRVVTLFKENKVTLNGRYTTNNSYMLKSGDILSIRGYGKYVFDEFAGETRKGRAYIHLQKYT
jgi:RNA-binding protein YlmH